MIEFLRAYFEDLDEFLPKKLFSSPISKQVKAKVMAVMGENFKIYNPPYFALYRVRQTIHVSDTDPFDLALLPEVLEQNYCNYTYYKWVKTELGYDLVLFNYKPKEYVWYYLQVFGFLLGSILSILLAFVTTCLAVYYFFVVSDVGSENLLTRLSIYFVVTWASIIFCGFSLIYIDLYVKMIRRTTFGKYLLQVVHFDKIGDIDKPITL